MSKTDTSFETAIERALNDLRVALVELFDSVEADPLSPQDVARRFGLNKTLTWNVSRLIQAPAGLAAVNHVPGKAAIEKMLQATRRDGASASALAGVRSATDEFERTVEIHVGDRATLDLVLDSVTTPNNDGLERSRKLAFRGNSGLYGVQAKTKLLTAFLAPNPDAPDRLDMAMIAGYAGFRRLRADARWPIFTPRGWSSGEDPISSDWQPIEPGDNGFAGLGIMQRFSRGSLPEMETQKSASGCDVMLKPGAIGNPGAFDCYRGDYMRSAAPLHATEPGEKGEFGASITSPVEVLLIDLIVHESLAFALAPDVVVFGRLFPSGDPAADDSEFMELPIRKSVTDLPGRPPAVATSLVPNYADMVRAVYAKLDWDPARFRGVRLQMSYPPFNSTVLLRFRLPESPR